MKNLRFFALALFTLFCISTATKAHAQSTWVQGPYAKVTVETDTKSGTNSYYTYSLDSSKGIMTAGCSGSTSGYANIQVLYQVTFTWSGCGAPTSLTATGYADVTGNTAAAPGSSAAAYSHVSTTAFDAYHNQASSPPNYGGTWHGTATAVSPTSPVTYQIDGSAFTNYSGSAGATADTAVYFQ